MSGTTKTPLLESRYEGEEGNKKVGVWNRFLDVEEAKTQVLFSVPMIITNVSYYSITLISVMFAGHLGKAELAGATLANSWATVTGLALMTGLSGALETLCGQGYGAKLYRMLGIYLQASIITSFIISIFVSILWWYSEPILLLLHQEPEVAKMATIYMRHLIPGLFAYACLQCVLRFLQTQTVVMPLVICSVVPLVVHVGITYTLVYWLNLGFEGAALSAVISLWISFLMLALYVNYAEKFKYTWEGLSTECFQYIIPNMKLAIPSAVMVCLEYWAFEILVLVAGLMPNSQRSTSLIAMCVNTEAVTFMITYGFSAAVSTRVSNELGAGNADRAKNAVAVTLKLSVILALTVIVSLLFGHDLWASAFSDSPEIKNEFAAMTPLLAISILFDSAQGVLSGVSRGCGWQHLAAWTNLAAFYGIGMPIALLLAFKLELYAKGLWIGLICGLFCQACTLLVITLRTKWSAMELSVDNDKARTVLVEAGNIECSWLTLFFPVKPLSSQSSPFFSDHLAGFGPFGGVTYLQESQSVSVHIMSGLGDSLIFGSPEPALMSAS
ncbi:Multi antimicrobial extrusion protein [Macleaya cordata]|uniref:Protein DETOXIFICATION n=1 Tax=Macleaya cordata TaxID=56857 RepID=A0A200QWQ1_MACCD|nr:Multi antimicrobial extrusion protein [Macleaya cordata]